MKRTIITLLIIYFFAARFVKDCSVLKESAGFKGAVSPVACETIEEAAKLFIGQQYYQEEYDQFEIVTYRKRLDLSRTKIKALDLGEYSAADVKSGESGTVYYRKPSSDSYLTDDISDLPSKEVYFLTMEDGIHYYTPAVEVGETAPYSMMVKLHEASETCKEYSMSFTSGIGDVSMTISIKRNGDMVDVATEYNSTMTRYIAFKANGKCYYANYNADKEWTYQESELDYATALVYAGAAVEDIDVSDEVKEQVGGTTERFTGAMFSEVVFGSFRYKSEDTLTFSESIAGAGLSTSMEYTLADNKIQKFTRYDSGTKTAEITYTYKDVVIELPSDLKNLMAKDGINV